MLKLSVADLRFPKSSWEPDVLVITLRDAKNRASLGRLQFGMVRDPALVRWTRWLVDGAEKEIKLWPGSYAKFCKLFARTLCRLGLDRLRLTPGCLRPGAATRAFIDGCSIADLKYRGRWRAESSLEVYIQEAMCHLTASDLTDAEHHGISNLILASTPQWDQPPALPASAFFHRDAQWRGLTLAKRRLRKTS